MEIVAALRCYRWGPTQASYTPPNKDVVLGLFVRNPPAEWLDDKNPIYVKAGDRRCELISRSISSYSTIGDAPPFHAAFFVPNDVVEMTLVIGELPPVKFRVEKKSHDFINPNDPPL